MRIGTKGHWRRGIRITPGSAWQRHASKRLDAPRQERSRTSDLGCSELPGGPTRDGPTAVHFRRESFFRLRRRRQLHRSASAMARASQRISGKRPCSSRRASWSPAQRFRWLAHGTGAQGGGLLGWGSFCLMRVLLTTRPAKESAADSVSKGDNVTAPYAAMIDLLTHSNALESARTLALVSCRSASGDRLQANVS